ncbi:MAG: phosphodiester glycosidase family protein [Lachnospiraceae bacterium]|nr:phosphodiester glycosidase family protein [Lachnospiraceae bacterium]
MKRQRPIWAVVFGVLLTAYTVYAMLDVFVIKRPMKENATEVNLSVFDKFATATPTPSPTAAPVVTQAPNATATPTVPPEPTATPTPSYFTDEVVETDTSYSNDHLNIQISEIREHRTQVHIVEIRVSSARYLLTAFAKDTYGRNIYEKTSRMAASKDAILAINGDNYGSREGGYVIRNGVLYRETKNARMDVLCIMPDGDFVFSHSNRATAQELAGIGAWQAFTFGPVLIDNSEIVIQTDTEVDLCYVTNPRTAIGMVEPLHYFIVVADGRTKESHGLSLYEVADIMLRLGCTKAFNLDGGGSSTCVFRGKYVNFPTSEGTLYERGVSDILYVQ